MQVVGMPTTSPVSRSAPAGHRGHVRLAIPADHDAIHRLNYRTFVEEIPQHPLNPERRLVDRFHGENIYAVCEVEGVVVGMVAGRATRPFSLDGKLGCIDQYLPTGCVPVEIRLLAVAPAFRSTRVFVTLVGFLARHLLASGFDVAVISGTTRQLHLYHHLGFREFGPLIGTEGARYQPMLITADEVAGWPHAMGTGRLGVANFMPGPVEMRDSVHLAFRAPPISHRSVAFLHAHDDTVARLCVFTQAKHASLFLGSGTLANDVVAAALLPLGARGIVATNGEFGDRLVDHARRAGLAPEEVRTNWGEPLDYVAMERSLSRGGISWLWAVHCETSTGVLNDVSRMASLAERYGARLAIDAISSIGTVPVDFRRVHLASGVSSKALGAYAGVAIVFHDGQPVARPNLPRYLDLAHAHASRGVPFTQSSNLLAALRAALARDDWDVRFARIARSGAAFRTALYAEDIAVLAPRAHASPAVHTVPIADDICSRAVGDHLRDDGILVSYESGYLRDRNWLQFCLMGEWPDERLADAPAALHRAINAAGIPSHNGRPSQHSER